MGFRSTFTTEDYWIGWPGWFVLKYWDLVHSRESRGTLAAKVAAKTYPAEGTNFSDLPEDIRRAIDWDTVDFKRFVLVYLHECGGITRVQIERDRVRYSEPVEWEETDGVTHAYCRGCSDLKIEEPPPSIVVPTGVVLEGGPNDGWGGTFGDPAEEIRIGDPVSGSRYVRTDRATENGRAIYAFDATEREVTGGETTDDHSTDVSIRPSDVQ